MPHVASLLSQATLSTLEPDADAVSVRHPWFDETTSCGTDNPLQRFDDAPKKTRESRKGSARGSTSSAWVHAAEVLHLPHHLPHMPHFLHKRRHSHAPSSKDSSTSTATSRSTTASSAKPSEAAKLREEYLRRRSWSHSGLEAQPEPQRRGRGLFRRAVQTGTQTAPCSPRQSPAQSAASSPQRHSLQLVRTNRER